MIVYLDTSSLVKLYIEEAGSSEVREMVEKSTVVSTSAIAYAEARAAFARKQREGGFSAIALRKIVDDLNREWEHYFVIEVSGGLIRTAGDVAEKHFLRGFDSIHLASALNLKAKIAQTVYFSSSDDRLNNAARKEGLPSL